MRYRRLQWSSVRVGTRLNNESRGSQSIAPSSILGYDNLFSLTCHLLTSTFISLLDQIDVVAKPQRAFTAVVATRSELFLQYDAQHVLARKRLTELGRSYGLATLLIFRLRQFSRTNLDENGRIANRTTDLIGLKCPAFLANLEHMLLCLQQAALEALICCNIKLLITSLVRWYQSWKQRRYTTEAWFTEWPSGRRPLSTTWPWNIKAALVVLWGVCWMFPGDDDSAGGSPWNQAAGFPYFWIGPLPPTATGTWLATKAVFRC